MPKHYSNTFQASNRLNQNFSSSIYEKINTYMLISELLNEKTLLEMDFYDRSPIVPILKKYRDKWVHFSRGVRPKFDSAEKSSIPHIGINYKSHHGDPKGIYFYPISYILSGVEKVLSGRQYGLDFEFFYICDIDQSTPGINLGTINWIGISQLAYKNGWGEFYTEFREKPLDEQKSLLNRWVDINKPGAFLWGFVDYMDNHKIINKNKAYRGMNWIYDPNNSIIHSNEPHQILVLNPEIIKIIYSSSTKSNHKEELETEYKTVIINLFKKIRGEYGNGIISWKYKVPSLTFSVNGIDCELKLSGYKKNKLEFYYKKGDLQGDRFLAEDFAYTDKTMEDIFEIIDAAIRKVSSYKSEFINNFSTGIFTNQNIEQASHKIFEKIFNKGENVYSKTIYDAQQLKDVSVVLRDNVSVDFLNYRKMKNYGIIQFYTRDLRDKKQEKFYSITVNSSLTTGGTYFYNNEPRMTTIGGIISMQFTNEEEPDWEDMAKSYIVNLRRNLLVYKDKLLSKEQYDAFVGYFALEGGVSFNGEIQKQLQTEIDYYYNSLEDKDAFIRQVRDLIYNHTNR